MPFKVRVRYAYRRYSEASFVDTKINEGKLSMKHTSMKGQQSSLLSVASNQTTSGTAWWPCDSKFAR